MTWTYDGSPGTATAAERRDAVRFFTGDTDTGDQQVTDEEITFSLAQTSNDVYMAAARIARGLSAKFARKADTSFESVKTQFSQLQEHYHKLAAKLEQDAAIYGTAGVAIPAAGGISIDGIEAAEDDDDRPQPAFRRGMWDNPPDFRDPNDRQRR